MYKEYILNSLEKNIMSDEELLNNFFRFKKHYYTPSALVKWWSSLIRVLKYLTQKWILEEVKEMRKDRYWTKRGMPSAEIFYMIKQNKWVKK